MTKNKKSAAQAVAVENISMQEALDSFDFVAYRKGQRITGVIKKLNYEGITLNINAKHEGFIPHSEVLVDGLYKPSDFSVGQEIEAVFLEGRPDESGKILLSAKAIKQKEIDEDLLAVVKDGSVFSVTITSVNAGGLEASLGSFSVFIPASQVKLGREEDLKQYLKKDLDVVATEINYEKNQITASRRIILQEEREKEREIKQAEWEERKAVRAVERQQQAVERAERKAQRDEREAEWALVQQQRAETAEKRVNELVAGDIVKGRVARFTQYGAFVDIGGMDALLHRTHLSFNTKATFESLLEIGKEYDFKILEVDKTNKKVALGFRQLHEKHPWETARERYLIGSTHKAKILRTAPFGVFVSLEPRIEALVRINHISHDFIEDIAKAVTIGRSVDVKILTVEADKRQISASIKDLLPKPERVRQADESGEISESGGASETSEGSSSAGGEQETGSGTGSSQAQRPQRKKPIVRTTTKTSKPVRQQRKKENVADEEVVDKSLPTTWEDKSKKDQEPETALAKALRGLGIKEED
ncbi:MAG: S1 RNA-binding domain-containing protein [Firmicutes bacterium]|nr:S1 RNA-binding domain-containing protein [Bacillota bacterium]